MTKYVLQSGGMNNNIEGAKLFFKEMLSGLGNNPKILMCFFALPREVWEVKYTQYTEGFRDFIPKDIKPEFELAFPEVFPEQINNNTVLYMHGGDDNLIQYWLRQFDIPCIWTGKVVATNSASTHALSESFWTCDWRKCMDGIGILPIKTLAHYDSQYGNEDPRGPIDWKEARKELEHYGDGTLPVYALREGEFKVIEVSE